MLIVVVAIAPVLALIIYFYHRDKYEKEPLGLLLKAFLGGAIVTILIMLVEGFLSILIRPVNIFVIKIFLMAFLIAGLVEEGLKFSVFKFLIYRNKEFNEPYDGILYSVMISLGYATLENIAYVMLAFFKEGFVGIAYVGISRAIFAVPGHALFAIIMGYYFGLAKFTKNKTLEGKYMYKGLGLAILAHGLYDFLLFTRSWLGILFMIVLFIYCWRISLKTIRVQVEKSPFKD